MYMYLFCHRAGTSSSESGVAMKQGVELEFEVIRWRELWRAKRALVGGSGAMSPRKVLNFRHAEITSRAIWG